MDDPEDSDTPMASRWNEPLKDEDKRPSIKRYTQNQKFRPGDSVRIKATSTELLRGPYTVAEVHSGNKYTLEQSNRSLVDNGKKFDEMKLEHAS